MHINNMVDGNTLIACVIGNPINHTLSPQIHNTLAEKMGYNLIYVPVKAEEANLGKLIDGFREMGILGFNITIPFKSVIMNYLDQISEEAQVIGAVNTVSHVNGKLIGHNTDGIGFLKSFTDETKVNPAGSNYVIFGAGGTAKAISVTLAQNGVSNITIINRTKQRAEELSSYLNKISKKNVSKAYKTGTTEAIEVIKNADILINTTSIGMTYKTGEMPIDISVQLSSKQIVYDVIYTPVETDFLEYARSFGCITINGLGMLVNQAVEAFEIWTKQNVPDKLRRQLITQLSNYIDDK